MKNKILFALLLVGAIALSVVYVMAYDHAQAKVAADHAQTVAKQTAVNKAEADRAAAETAEKARLAQECQDGLTAYNKLTPVQQKTTPKPDCNLQQIQ